MSDHEESMIKTPQQLIGVVFGAFFIPLIVILLLLTYANSGTKESARPSLESSNAITKPVANLNFVDSKAPKVYKTGEELYKNVCSSCHATGAAGAPAFGNTGLWAPRIKKGYDTLTHSAIVGKNAMPARGGASPDDASDFEIGRAVVYMVNSSGGKFADPKEPVAPADAK